MKKNKHILCLISAIVSVLLLTWGNITAQTTMPVTFTFDLVGNFNGYSSHTNDDFSFRNNMFLYSASHILIDYQSYNLDVTDLSGIFSREYNWHPTVTYDLELGQQYYFKWSVQLAGDLQGTSQLDFTMSGVGNSSGAQWLVQDYYADCSLIFLGGLEDDGDSMSDPRHATASASLYSTWLKSSAQYGSSLLDIIGHIDPQNYCYDFRSYASGEIRFQPVPEPASLVLLGAGVLGLGVVGWYRRRRKD